MIILSKKKKRKEIDYEGIKHFDVIYKSKPENKVNGLKKRDKIGNNQN